FPASNYWRQYFEQTKLHSFDLIFVSHVFFNSGTAIGDINQLVKTEKDQGKIVLDGYHSYFALPVDLSQIEDRVYFIAGHYKYAAGGEGMCFMACPPEPDRPIITGWFAEFEALASKQGEISYPTHGGRYLGSTMDFTPLYRALSVYQLLERLNVDVNVIHAHVQKLQNRFLQILKKINSSHLNQSMLIHDGMEKQGHFLAFNFKNEQNCQEFEQKLRAHGILTDSRGSVLRFGFSLYQDIEDLERLRCIEKF